jgi:hypothetical protein
MLTFMYSKQDAQLRDEILESEREVFKVTNYLLHEAFLRVLEFA